MYFDTMGSSMPLVHFEFTLIGCLILQKFTQKDAK